jgi:hypothetical protein
VREGGLHHVRESGFNTVRLRDLLAILAPVFPPSLGDFKRSCSPKLGGWGAYPNRIESGLEIYPSIRLPLYPSFLWKQNSHRIDTPHAYTLSPQAARFVKAGDSCTVHNRTHKGVINAPLPTRIDRSILAYTCQLVTGDIERSRETKPDIASH